MLACKEIEIKGCFVRLEKVPFRKSHPYKSYIKILRIQPIIK